MGIRTRMSTLESQMLALMLIEFFLRIWYWIILLMIRLSWTCLPYCPLFWTHRFCDLCPAVRWSFIIYARLIYVTSMRNYENADPTFQTSPWKIPLWHLHSFVFTKARVSCAHTHHRYVVSSIMWKWGFVLWLGTGACWDASPQKSNMKQPHLSVWSSARSAAGIKHSPNSINIRNRLSPACPTAQQTPDKICNQAENMANGDPRTVPPQVPVDID